MWWPGFAVEMKTYKHVGFRALTRPLLYPCKGVPIHVLTVSFALVQENKPIPLTKRSVDGIQLQGGTILGTSRGGANMK
jgi:hypothetical protein